MKKSIIISYLFLVAFASSLFANEVNIFSARHYDSDVQLYEKFTAKTGIKVNVVSGKSGALEKRIIEEGADSKADLYITADAGRLGAFEANLQGGLTSSVIKSAVPSNFRTSKWTGIAKRARIVYFAPERVSGAELAGLTYESLADPKWKGRLVIRASNNIYNQSLVASLIKNNGKGKVADWSKGMVSNMARSPKGNDRAQILAVAAGEAPQTGLQPVFRRHPQRQRRSDLPDWPAPGSGADAHRAALQQGTHSGVLGRRGRLYQRRIPEPLGRPDPEQPAGACG